MQKVKAFMPYKKLLVIVFFLGSWLFVAQSHATEFKMIFQSSDPANSPNFALQKDWAKKLKKDSKGQIQIDLLPVGSAVEHTKTLDAINAGILDGHITDTSYFSGKDPAFALIANPVGAYSSPAQMLDFMNNGGGNELMREMLEPYGAYFIGATTPGLESLVSKKPLKNMQDLKGLRIRTPEGLVKEVFSAAGSFPVKLASSEVFIALNKSIIEAADYTIFSSNYTQGMSQVAKHSIYPGFHSMPLVEISMNLKKWKSMPENLKNMLTQSVKEYSELLYKTVAKQDEKTLKEAKKAGVIIHNWSNEERRKFRLIAKEQWKKIAKRTKNAQKVYDKLTEYLKQKGLLATL